MLVALALLAAGALVVRGAGQVLPEQLAMFPALAREHGATLLPFLLDSVAGHPALNQADGIHPNYVGERLVTETVWRGLRPMLEGAATPGH